MKRSIFKVIENKKIANQVMQMTLEGDTSAITASGQFVNLKIDGLYLRRPISVCDCYENKLVLIYKIVGKGTLAMSNFKKGINIDILTGLGNGYSLEKSGDKPLLIGGGVGVPPLYFLAKILARQGKKVSVVMGFNSSADVFFEEEFKKLGATVYVCTADGTAGAKGFVTDILPSDYSYVYTCGPEPMLKAVYNATKTSGQYSFEERMGCGFGACMGCSCKTLYGNKRICKDGPVLQKEEIIWEK